MTSLFLLGFFVGPVQLVNAELTVDVTFLGDETAVKSLQQFGGNLYLSCLSPSRDVRPSWIINCYQACPCWRATFEGSNIMPIPRRPPSSIPSSVIINSQ